MLLDLVLNLALPPPYAALSLLRAVAAGAGKKLRDCRRAAITVSFHASLLAGVVPFGDAARELRQTTGEQYEENLLVFFFCEAIKILRREGVLEPLHRYDDARGPFAERLASTRCKRLADAMEGMDSVELGGDSEAELVNRACPGAKRTRHSSTDVVRRWGEVKAASLRATPAENFASDLLGSSTVVARAIGLAQRCLRAVPISKRGAATKGGHARRGTAHGNNGFCFGSGPCVPFTCTAAPLRARCTARRVLSTV